MSSTVIFHENFRSATTESNTLQKGAYVRGSLSHANSPGILTVLGSQSFLSSPWNRSEGSTGNMISCSVWQWHFSTRSIASHVYAATRASVIHVRTYRTYIFGTAENTVILLTKRHVRALHVVYIFPPPPNSAFEKRRPVLLDKFQRDSRWYRDSGHFSSRYGHSVPPSPCVRGTPVPRSGTSSNKYSLVLHRGFHRSVGICYTFGDRVVVSEFRAGDWATCCGKLRCCELWKATRSFHW